MAEAASSAIRAKPEDRDWVCAAIDKIRADFNRSSDTHLIKLDLPGFAGVSLYLKDESTHPSGSLKHRLARSLFLYGLCNGHIGKDTPIIEASSGSTAISEAYFARLLGLPFIAVVPKSTAKEKIEEIEFHGGECRKVGPHAIYEEAEALAARTNGHYMDQFTHAERATDWRGNNNIAESLFAQMSQEPHPVPEWIVVSAGTGGTSATIGRYIRYRPELFRKTKLCVVDPENSVFFRFFPVRGCQPSFAQRIADRGDRSAAGRAVLSAAGDRSHDARPGCGIDRDDLVAGAGAGAQMRRLDRHQRLRRAGTPGRDGGAGRTGEHRHHDLRPRRALPGELLQSVLGRGSGPGTGAVRRATEPRSSES